MWDDRIDEAARRLTEGEPGPGFRARVLARLDEAPAGRAWPRGWFFVPAAVTAALTLAFIVQFRQPDVAAPQPAIEQQAANTPVPPGGPEGPTHASAGAGPGGPEGSPYVTRLERPRYQVVRPDDFAPPELVIDTLDIPPATIAPLLVGALEESQVLASGTLDIAPLDSDQ